MGARRKGRWAGVGGGCKEALLGYGRQFSLKKKAGILGLSVWPHHLPPGDTAPECFFGRAMAYMFRSGWGTGLLFVLSEGGDNRGLAGLPRQPDHLLI